MRDSYKKRTKCKIVASNKNAAEECCAKHSCTFCGKEVEEKHWFAHKKCIKKNKVDNSKKLDNWEGWVFYENKYYQDVEELIEDRKAYTIENVYRVKQKRRYR